MSSTPPSNGQSGADVESPRQKQDHYLKACEDRDRAVGAVLLMAWDGAITMSRAAELLGMGVIQIRDEQRRIFAKETP